MEPKDLRDVGPALRWARATCGPPEEVCKPDSVTPTQRVGAAAIHLVPRLPGGSSDRPEENGRAARRPTLADRTSLYTVLLRVGFTERPLSRTDLVSSYLTISPLLRTSRSGAVSFLWHFPPIARRRR